MAYEIDPYVELERYLPVRTVSTIRMLMSGDSPLSPGRKVRLGEALIILGKGEKESGLDDAVALKGIKRIARGTFVDEGCRFYQTAEYEKPALKTKVAERLLPEKKHPEARRTSRGGGQVKAEIGPLDDGG